MSPTRNGAARLFGALLCTFTFAACQPAPESTSGEPTPPETGESENPVIYGTDNRTDVYAHTDATLRARAEQATVALMSPSGFNATNPDNVTFNGSNLGTYENLCTDQRFRSDPTAAWCSGTLIDDDLVLTAGHCVTSAAECSGTRFVFNYYRTSANALKTVTTADIFSCQSIVARRQSTSGGRNLDYAILKLDRSAAPRFTPAPIRPGNTAMTAGANVAVIGSGSGIPFKIDSGGSVRNARASTLDFFVASTDTFAGNSGSGVYETATYTVAGILVRGETDYIARGSCNIVNTCSESGTDCDGEEITYVRPAIDALCAVVSNERLCGTTNPPTGGTSYAYSASNTNSASINTVNKTVALTAGQKITVGTCGVTGASVTGDSYLRFFGPAGTELASNDDECGGNGSKLSYTATAAGNYEIRAGCYSTGACSGTVAWVIETGTTNPTSGSFTFSASNTSSAQANTVNRDVVVAAGQRLSFGTCSVTGASGSGDTFLRLYNVATGQQVVSNDDSASCGTLSYATYSATTAGTYQIRAGCYDNTSCNGTVAWTLQ
ncbi:serine protease [Myxococcus sp. K15C18031901]|uniref:serine protease n=1 Tax=Myxococcus dinghuensis TaxID=2906761 RepID=UPI0020A7A9F2|nr:serine protease [Myxococcus dinghuensis]MCP3104382.1 serine protease [Myxococcus dinghuensis]